MSILANLKTDNSVQDEVDVIGGGGPLDTAVYPGTVTMAYAEKSSKGALGMVLHIKTEVGRDIRQTLWMTSGDDKGNKNTYETKAGERKYLPGFNLANSLCLLTVGKEVGDMDLEEKVVSIYSFDAKAEVPTKVNMFVDLIGQDILSAVFRQTVDKKAKGDDGQYRPTGETRDENEIDKFFRARDRMTTAEIRAGAEEATFCAAWEEKWAGQVRDKTEKGPQSGGAKGNVATGSFGGAPAGGNTKPKASLFN